MTLILKRRYRKPVPLCVVYVVTLNPMSDRIRKAIEEMRKDFFSNAKLEAAEVVLSALIEEMKYKQKQLDEVETDDEEKKWRMRGAFDHLSALVIHLENILEEVGGDVDTNEKE